MFVLSQNKAPECTVSSASVSVLNPPEGSDNLLEGGRTSFTQGTTTTTTRDCALCLLLQRWLSNTKNRGWSPCGRVDGDTKTKSSNWCMMSTRPNTICGPVYQVSYPGTFGWPWRPLVVFSSRLLFVALFIVLSVRILLIRQKSLSCSHFVLAWLFTCLSQDQSVCIANFGH